MALEGRKAALMQNHGAVVVGQDLIGVLELVPYLEYICQVQLQAGTYGSPRVLTDEELEEVTLGLRGYGQSSQPAPSSAP